MPKWDAETYLRFADERTRPALDLAARIDVPHPKRIIDLGCGPGNSTTILKQQWPEAEITGLDSSPEMIVSATESRPEGKWVLADVATWKAEIPYDIVFSNAALQWVPDHALLLPHLLDQVAPGGALAVQMPAHYRSSAHQVMLQVADDPAWRHLLKAARTVMTKESPEFYYNVLQPLTSRLILWETTYYHILDGPQGIVDWFRGTGLRPFLAALESEEQRLLFEKMVLEGYARDYPPQKDGRVLFPFRRLFFVATRR